LYGGVLFEGINENAIAPLSSKARGARAQWALNEKTLRPSAKPLIFL
jgi:hypothetical protein